MSKATNGSYKWNKGEQLDFKLSDNFDFSEVECKCKNKDCIVQTIDIGLINKLQKLRELLGSPIKVTSAYRCLKHNKSIKGSSKSQHLLGLAVDITATQDSIQRLLKLAEQIDFNGIGDYTKRNFVHLDCREGQRVRFKGK